MNQVTVILTLKSKQATESLGRLLEAVEAAVKPDGGYEPIETFSDDIPLGSSQWVSGERWLAQLGNDSLALTLARIKQQLAKTIFEWAAQELRLDPTPAPTLNELETNFRDWFEKRYLQPYYGGIALIDAIQWGQHLIQQFSGESPHVLLVEAERKVELLRYALESIATYGLDTLSGPTDELDDRTWQRNGVIEMTRRARKALIADEASPAMASVGILHVSDFRGLENADFQQTADLPAGRYELFTTLTPQVMVAPVPIARPFDEWHEDYGAVLCWRFPIEEPPHVGCPLDSDWDGYYTHWTPLVCPADPTKPAEAQP